MAGPFLSVYILRTNRCHAGSGNFLIPTPASDGTRDGLFGQKNGGLFVFLGFDAKMELYFIWQQSTTKGNKYSLLFDWHAI